jgi:hypothetical protein
MTFEVKNKKDNTVSFIDNIVNLFPWDVTTDPNFKAWRKCVALRKNTFESKYHIVKLCND